MQTCPRLTTSRNITDRSGPKYKDWRRGDNHLIVREVLLLIEYTHFPHDIDRCVYHNNCEWTLILMLKFSQIRENNSKVLCRHLNLANFHATQSNQTDIVKFKSSHHFLLGNLERYPSYMFVYRMCSSCIKMSIGWITHKLANYSSEHICNTTAN